MEQYLKPRDLNNSHTKPRDEKSSCQQKNTAANNSQSCRDYGKADRKKSAKESLNLKSKLKLTDEASKGDCNGHNLAHVTPKKHNHKIKKDLNSTMMVACEDGKLVKNNEQLKDSSKRNSGMSGIRNRFKKLCKNSRKVSDMPKLNRDLESSNRKSNLSHNEDLSVSDDKPSVVKCDAFKVLMDSRHKTIGSNSPGKVAEQMEMIDTQQKESKVKRELFLKQWADKKGAKLKREKEEQREVYVTKVLNKRAKSFKALLLNVDSSQACKSNNTPFKSKVILKDSTKRIKSTKDIGRSILVSEKEEVKHKNKHKSKGGNSMNLSRSELEDVMDISSQDSSDVFLDKLSSSLKKKESVLSYFKVENMNESSRISKDGSDSEEDKCTRVLKVKFTPKQKGKMKLKNKIHKQKNSHEDTQSRKVKKHDAKKKANNANNRNVEKILNPVEEDSLLIFDDEATSHSVECTEMKKSTGERSEDMGRPKRNIKKPIKYLEEMCTDYEESSDSVDLQKYPKNISAEESPKKKSKIKIKSKSIKDKENKLSICTGSESDNKVSPIKIINIKSPCAMKCVKSPKIRREDIRKESVHVAPKNVKLAPLFVRNVPKPSVDPSVLEARHKFLHSGIPESIKKQMEKTINPLTDVRIFPTISHVQQKPEECHDCFYVWNLSSNLIKLNSSFEICDYSTDNIFIDDFRDFKFLTEITTTPKFSETIFKFPKYKVKDGLSKIKDLNPDFPVYKFHRKIHEKLVCMVNNVNGSGNHKDNLTQANDSPDESFLMWTEKYKPFCSDDIVGNFNSIKYVKRWLALWKEYNEITYNKIPKKRKQDSDSSCDFLDSESRDSGILPDNTMVLIGPRGSGKTSSVYAIANELGINVLEVNASSKRTGKKMMSELLEATQSHKVLVKMNSEESANNFSNIFGDSTKANSALKSKRSSLLEENSDNKRNKNNKRKRNTTFNNADDSSQKSSAVEGQQMSLMLIEDADIVFDEDDGFVSALAHIVQTSKRPMILVASDVKCPHLQRFMTDTNIVMYNSLPGSLLAPWLDIIILLESGRIIPGLCKSLLEINKGDMRKTILQLQYWILGSAESIKIGREKLNSSQVAKYKVDIVEESSPDYGFESLLDDDSNASISNDKVVSFADGKKLTKNKSIHKTSNTSTISEQNNIYIINSLSKELLSTLKLENSLLDSSKTNEQEITMTTTDSFTESNCSNINMDCTMDYCEYLSCIDLMMGCSRCGINDPNETHSWQKPLGDGLSESEDLTSYRSHDTFCYNWCESLKEMSLNHINKMQHFDPRRLLEHGLNKTGMRKIKSMSNKSYMSLSAAVPPSSQLERRSVCLDYMSTLRNICRSENSRSESNLKRNNRFYHYLTSLNVHAKDNIFDYASNCFGS